MQPDVERAVRELIVERAPSWTVEQLTDGTWLWDRDVDLDSVDLIEVVCACEDRFGVTIPAAMLNDEQLTVRTLVDNVRRQLGDATSTDRTT